MAPSHNDDYTHGRIPEHEMSDSTTTRPISIPHPSLGGDRRSRVGDMDPAKEKRQSMRVNGITISTELFEKMFLVPQRESKRSVLDNLGNPTPIGLLGIMLSLTPLSCDLMGWRGAGGDGIASVGAYYWFGGLLLIIGGILNFITGDTFSFVVFEAYGAFWLTFAFTIEPSYLAYGAYATNPNDPQTGLTSEGFTASFGFFLLFMGLLNLVFLICSLRTDITHVICFASLVLAFGLLTGEYFNIALGNTTLASELGYSAGATLFVTSMTVWWLFLAEMLAILDFPFRVPVGDISHLIKGMSEKQMGHITHMV